MLVAGLIISAVKVSQDLGTFWLCLINVVGYVLDHVVRLSWMPHLYLNHAMPRWWQLVTSAFCHADWAHLSSNLFMVYVFGKLIEEKEGAFGVWMAYLVTAIGGNLASLWLYPTNTISLGASAAVFGMFAVSVLIRVSWKLKNLFEVGILGQFVVGQVFNEVNMQLQGGSITAAGQVAHVAHLGGALMGVLLILLLLQLPDPEAKKK